VLFVLACLFSIVVVHSGSVSVRGTVAQAAAYPTLALARRRLPFVVRTPTRLPALARLSQVLVFSGAAPHVIIIWATPIYTISLSELHVNDTTFVPVSGSRTVGVAGRLACLYIDSAYLYADPFYSLVQWQDSGVAYSIGVGGQHNGAQTGIALSAAQSMQ